MGLIKSSLQAIGGSIGTAAMGSIGGVLSDQWKEFFFITGTESSGVESTLTDEVDVSVENGNIVIKGADNAMIEVYSLNGQCVYSGIETTISIAAKGLYVVKVNGKSFKVMM